MSDAAPISISLKETPSRTRWMPYLIGLGACLVVGLCVVPALIIFPIVVVFHVTTGWFWFLQRVGPRIELSPAGIGLGLGALAALIVGAQLAIRSFAPETNWPWRRTAFATFGVLATFLAGICLVGLVHELSWWGRSTEPWVRYQNGAMNAALRTQSRNHLKQIGLAVHNYHGAFRQFPLGGVTDDNGRAGHGWMAALLPYIDQAPLYNQINFDVPWYDPANRSIYATRISEYENPKLMRRDSIVTDFAPAYYAGNSHLLQINRGLKIAEITDGTANTVFAGEVMENIRPWGDIANWRHPELGINRSPHGFGGPFTGGAHFLLSDGTVRFVSENISPEVFEALATPAAKDRVGDF